MKFRLQSVFLVYLGQYKSKSLIQGHFKKLEIKSFNLAPRLMGFYSLLIKILASKKTNEVCSGSLYMSTYASCICGKIQQTVQYSIVLSGDEMWRARMAFSDFDILSSFLASVRGQCDQQSLN